MPRALAILTAIIRSFAFHALKTGRDQKWLDHHPRAGGRVNGKLARKEREAVAA
jgi:hypothetical protein